MIGLVLSGGTGSRLLPLTKAVNKHLLPVFDRPLIHYSLDLLVACGINDVVIITNVGEHATQLSRQIGSGESLGLRSVSFLYQEQPLGTAHALSLCEMLVRNRGPIVVAWGDNIFEYVPRRSVETFSGGAKILVKKVASIQNYGRVVFEDGKVNNIISPNPQNHQGGYALTGLFIFDEAIFPFVNQVRTNQKGEVDLVDALKVYLVQNQLEAEEVQGFWLDAGHSIEGLYYAGQLVARYGANKLGALDADLSGSAAQRRAELIVHYEQMLFALEKERLLSSDLETIGHLAAEAIKKKLEIADLRIEESRLKAVEAPQGLLTLGHRPLQTIPAEAFYVLESFGSAQVKLFASAADIDTLIIDGTLLLVASQDYQGWRPHDIKITVQDLPWHLSSEVEEILVSECSELGSDRFVNNKLYSVRSYVPPVEHSGVLSVNLSYVSFFDYYRIWKVVHEPARLLGSGGRRVSILDSYGPQMVKLLQTVDGNSILPTIVNIQCAVITRDQFVVLMKRSSTVGFVPGHWSASFEETMTAEDTDFHTTVLRGYQEEFGQMAASNVRECRVLSLNFEYHSMAITLGCILRTDETCEQIRNSWQFAKHKYEASKIDFIPFALGETTWSLFEAERLWHPSSRKRLIEALFHAFGVDKTLAALYSAYLDRASTRNRS
jgi:glucose-1-phosphate thymidylyltransferase